MPEQADAVQQLSPGLIFESDRGETIILLRKIDFGLAWRCAITMDMGRTIGFKDSILAAMPEATLQKMKLKASIR